MISLFQHFSNGGKSVARKKTKQFEQHIDVFLNDDTEVTAFDIMASNGVIHVIDSVLD